MPRSRWPIFWKKSFLSFDARCRAKFWKSIFFSLIPRCRTAFWNVFDSGMPEAFWLPEQFPHVCFGFSSALVFLVLLVYANAKAQMQSTANPLHSGSAHRCAFAGATFVSRTRSCSENTLTRQGVLRTGVWNFGQKNSFAKRLIAKEIFHASWNLFCSNASMKHLANWHDLVFKKIKESKQTALFLSFTQPNAIWLHP